MMSNPPKPRRHVIPIPVLPSMETAEETAKRSLGMRQPETPGAVQDLPYSTPDDVCLERFEEQLADQAVADLPTVFSEVFSVQRDQSQEINKQKQKLNFLQDKLKEAEEKKCELDADIVGVTNNIYTKDERIKHLNRSIKQLLADINQLVVKEVDGQLALKSAQKEMDIEAKDFKENCDRIEKYKDDVAEFEKSKSPVCQQMLQVQDIVEQQRGQKAVYEADREETERMVSGAVEEELLSDIDTLKTHMLQCGTEMKHNIDKISDERKKQKQISQTMKVLEKRNVAQMTRLKRQVKELQTRNRLKESQIKQLRDNVEQTRRNLEQ